MYKIIQAIVFNNLPGASADAPPPFSKRSGGSLRPNSTFTHSYEEKVGGEWKTKTGSFIKAVVYGTDSEAGVGGRFNYSVIEEFGSWVSQPQAALTPKMRNGQKRSVRNNTLGAER